MDFLVNCGLAIRRDLFNPPGLPLECWRGVFVGGLNAVMEPNPYEAPKEAKEPNKLLPPYPSTWVIVAVNVLRVVAVLVILGVLAAMLLPA